jgi:chromosome segregation ATPase
VPDHRDLSARLEELAGEETSRGLPNRFQGHLVTLKDKERTCKQQLNASIQELEVSRSTYKQLLKEYQSLKSELKTFVLVLDKASEGENPITSTILAEISEADIVKRLEEVRQNRDGTWLESKRAEKLELEKKMAAQSEDKARKKIVVMDQKAKHSELLARIRDRQEEYAKDRKQKAEVEDLLSGFIDVESDSSGTVSPAESRSTDSDEDG